MTTMRALQSVCGLAALVLAGCTPVPDLDSTLDDRLKTADFPDLVPIETLLPATPSRPEDASETADELAARRAALQARAARLNAPVVDDAARARMNAGIPPQD